LFEIKRKEFMNANQLIAGVALTVMTTLSPALCQTNTAAESSSTRGGSRDAANYIIRVQWKDATGITNHLQLLTSEGNFSLDTILTDRVKINESEIPMTVAVKGSLRVLGPEKGQLNLFLGRTIPYVTSSYGSGKEKSSSYQQLQVGLSSTFTVTFGKPMVIQSDAKEDVTILVKRAEN
jgi:hypothetical protein